MKSLGYVVSLVFAICAASSWAEDPLLGIVRAVKCLNCVADSVVLQVDDPIENQEMEVRIPSREYNKILTPLGGRTLYVKPDSACFYWQIKLKSTDSTKSTSNAKIQKVKNQKLKTEIPSADSSNVSEPEPRFKESQCIPYTAKSLGIN